MTMFLAGNRHISPVLRRVTRSQSNRRVLHSWTISYVQSVNVCRVVVVPTSSCLARLIIFVDFPSQSQNIDQSRKSDFIPLKSLTTRPQTGQ